MLTYAGGEADALARRPCLVGRPMPDSAWGSRLYYRGYHDMLDRISPRHRAGLVEWAEACRRDADATAADHPAYSYKQEAVEQAEAAIRLHDANRAVYDAACAPA